MSSKAPKPDFGLYIHWPYCAQKCPYCDFNSYAQTPEDDRAWEDAFVFEIERHAALIGPRALRSIYFGGGTPSLMKASTIEAIINAAQKSWQFANDVEITLEANPSSVEQDKFTAFKSAGVNRVSVGIQALNDTDLKRLGRLHSHAESLKALDAARNCFDRMSFDLIYARQDQTLASWQSELSEALSFDPSHLSLYQLTLEPGTAFYDRFQAGRLRGLPDEDLAADMFDLTQDMAVQAGLQAYEVSNHAKPGFESIHNGIYWSAGEWVGIGPGAHGRIWIDDIRHATETYLAPEGWLSNVVKNGRGTRTSLAQTGLDHVGEYVMMGLRRMNGISLQKYKDICESDLEVNPELWEYGLIEQKNGRLTLTDKGRPVLNYVVKELLT
ncbi:MAG: radical SAM family heme chaperone HemW [Planktomarina sp.]